MNIHEIVRIWTQGAIDKTVLCTNRLFHTPQTRCGGGLCSRSASCSVSKILKSQSQHNCGVPTPKKDVRSDTVKTERPYIYTRWRPQMEIFSALLALCEGNSLVTSEFPPQRLVTRNFCVFFGLRLNKRTPVFWTNGRHRAHYDVITMKWISRISRRKCKGGTWFHSLKQK